MLDCNTTLIYNRALSEFRTGPRVSPHRVLTYVVRPHYRSSTERCEHGLGGRVQLYVCIDG